MGCVRVVYVSLDGGLHADYRTCTPHTNGSFVIEPAETTTSAEYSRHRERIDAYLTKIDLPAEWLTPGHYRKDVLRLEHHMQHLQSEISGLSTALADRERVVDNSAHALDRMTRELTAAEDRIAALLASASWRWMAPLRRIYAALHWLMRRR
jgi:uncharacterized coiled-coil protein SlyX